MFELGGRGAYPADIVPLVRDLFVASGQARPWDEFYSRASRAAAAAHPVQVLAVRYQGLDTAAHHAGGDAPDFAAPARPSDGLDRAYADIDREIGLAMESLTPGDLLLVVSGFGMRPVSPWKHLAARLLRDPDVTATHEDGPDGFLLAYGTTVAPGRKPRGSIVDVTPTVLYFLGLPIGRDMDGFARADLFAPSFTADRPITFIPSHGG
jgi:hypothetical protein